MELLLEFQQLVAGERRPSSPVSATAWSGTRRDGRRRRDPAVRRRRRAVGGRRPALDVRLAVHVVAVGLIEAVAAGGAAGVVSRAGVDAASDTAVAVDDGRRRVPMSF